MAVDVQELAEEYWTKTLDFMEVFCTEEILDYKEHFRYICILAFKDGYKHGKEEK